MRASFLLIVVVPLVAHADATPPANAAAEAPAASMFYTGPAEGVTPAKWGFSEYAVGQRLQLVRDGRAVTVRAVQEPAVVLGRHDRWYVVDDGGKQRRLFGGDLTPLGFVVAGRIVTVGFGADYKIHVHVVGGGDLAFDPAGEGYLGRKGGNVSAAPVAAAVAGVELLALGSHPEACSDSWDGYVSIIGGVPHKALELFGAADPPLIATSTVKFEPRSGTAVVTITSNEGVETGPAKKTLKRYRWNGTVFVERAGSKRSSRHSK